MSKSILYFHGFASSSNSNKAEVLKKYISKNYKNAEILIPDLDNNFKLAVSQIHELINSAKSIPNLTNLFEVNKKRTKSFLIDFEEICFDYSKHKKS